MNQTHHQTCPLCSVMCGLTLETEGHRISSIRGDALDPFSRGHICPKAGALQDLHEDPCTETARIADEHHFVRRLPGDGCA